MILNLVNNKALKTVNIKKHLIKAYNQGFVWHLGESKNKCCIKAFTESYYAQFYSKLIMKIETNFKKAFIDDRSKTFYVELKGQI